MTRFLLSTRPFSGLMVLGLALGFIGFTFAINAQDDLSPKPKTAPKGLTLPKLFSFTKEGEKTTPFPGVEHVERTTNTPRQLTQHLVYLDTKNPNLRILSTRPEREGNHPPGTTKMETTRAFLERTKAHIAINANFFDNGAEAKKRGSLVC